MKYRICTVFLQIICLLLLSSLNKTSALQNGILYKRNPVTVAYAAQRQGVKIAYTEDFPYLAGYERIHFSDCFKVFRFKHAHGKAGRPVLRCQANIRLLRLPPVIDQWEALQKRNGYFFLDIKELNIMHVRARITERTSDYRNSGIKLSGVSSAMVTGIFSRYVLDTREYIFQNMETGIRSTVIATPNHRFYVKNKRAFVPIGRISFEDNLVNISNQRVRLLSSKLSSGFPGKSVNFNVPVKVYNMEIDKKHTYFAGAEHIMVHNVCKLTYKEIYDYFKDRQRLDEVLIDEDISEVLHNLSTLKIYMIEDDIDEMETMNGLRLAENEVNTFPYKEIFKQMGFCELISFNESALNDIAFNELKGKVSVWYLKYPFLQHTYEMHVLPCITTKQSFDEFVQTKTKTLQLNYFKFYDLIKNIDSALSGHYKEMMPEDALAILPMNIQKMPGYKLAL